MKIENDSHVCPQSHTMEYLLRTLLRYLAQQQNNNKRTCPIRSNNVNYESLTSQHGVTDTLILLQLLSLVVVSSPSWWSLGMISLCVWCAISITTCSYAQTIAKKKKLSALLCYMRFAIRYYLYICIVLSYILGKFNVAPHIR